MSEPNEDAQLARPLFSLTGGYDLPWLAEIGGLLMRLYFGLVICISAGISKFPLEGWFAGQVEALGFPLPWVFAWLAAMSEVAGGVLLALGLATRPVGVFLAATLGVAAFVFHKIPLSALYTTQHITLLYFWGFLFFALAGSGRLSLDGLLRRRQGIAAGLAVAIIGGFAIYCAGRTPPPVEEEAVATLESAELVAVAGSFNDWSVSATPMTKSEEGVWTATIETEAAGPVEFKFVADENWELSAGETDQADARFPITGVAEPGTRAGNIQAYLPAAGRYEVSLGLSDLGYRLEAIAEDAGRSPRRLALSLFGKISAHNYEPLGVTL